MQNPQCTQARRIFSASATCGSSNCAGVKVVCIECLARSACLTDRNAVCARRSILQPCDLSRRAGHGGIVWRGPSDTEHRRFPPVGGRDHGNCARPAAPNTVSAATAASRGGRTAVKAAVTALSEQPSAVDSGISAWPACTATSVVAVADIVGLAGDAHASRSLSCGPQRRKKNDASASSPHFPSPARPGSGSTGWRRTASQPLREAPRLRWQKRRPHTGPAQPGALRRPPTCGRD